MKKKKKVNYVDIKVGKYFKYYGVVYRKFDPYGGIPIIGNSTQNRFFWDDTKVIPVTVTIKVKEK